MHIVQCFVRWSGVQIQMSIFILLLPMAGMSQSMKGIVVDEITGKPISYVHVGVTGKNVGVITNEKGEFEINLSMVDRDEELLFSIIGYETQKLRRPQEAQESITVKLIPVTYEIPAVEIKANRKVKKLKLGRYKTSNTTTGQSGTDEFGFGGEWGLKIKYPGERYYLSDINFHTRFNTVDSVLFRLNVYQVENDMPGKSLLQKEIYTKSYANDKWITGHVSPQGLRIEEDVIVTFEFVRIWYHPGGSNYLFYTHGKGYKEGLSYSRESSHDKWSTHQRGDIAMYIIGIAE